jgi:hypothetical protein
MKRCLLEYQVRGIQRRKISWMKKYVCLVHRSGRIFQKLDSYLRSRSLNNEMPDTELGGEAGAETTVPQAEKETIGFAARYPVRDRKPAGGGRSDGMGRYQGFIAVAEGSQKLDNNVTFIAQKFKPPTDLKPKVSPDYQEPKGWKNIMTDEYVYF